MTVYRNGEGELGIMGEGCFVLVRIEQAPKLIEKLRAILREVGADGTDSAGHGEATRPATALNSEGHFYKGTIFAAVWSAPLQLDRITRRF